MLSTLEKSICTWIEKNYKFIVVGFFVLFLLAGISIYKDYGLSWDENSQWKYIGHVNFDFITHHNSAELLNSGDKYHGPAFEVFLIALEKIFKLSDSRDIFQMRHLATFLVFFISSIFFYLLTLKIFKNKTLALIGCLLYVLSPPVFAHSFYNSKDPVFLSFFTISIYLAIVFYEKRTLFWAFLCALITAFTIDIRIMGIIIPLILITLFLIELIFSFKERNKQNFFSNLAYFIFLIPLIILFWPVLWLGPIHHFIGAFKEAFYYHWNIDVFYLGKIYRSSELPWHYVPLWICISTPILYTVLFLTGTFVSLIKAIRTPLNFIKTQHYQLIALIWFFLPMLMILVLKSVVFDTGRHLYFLHGGFILIAVYGLEAIYKISKEKKTVVFIFNFILLFSFAGVIKSMIQLHPYEHLYFNSLAGKDMNEIKSRFEMDYWGLSSREVLENILQKDSSKQIKIFAESYPATLNARMMPLEERERLIYTDTAENADYFIADYRWHKAEDYVYQKEFYSVTIGNAKIMTAFKIRSEEELYHTVKGKKLLRFFTDFENEEQGWGRGSVSNPAVGAHSGLFTTKVDSLIEYSDGLSFTVTPAFLNKKNIVLKTSFWKYDDQPQSHAKFVVSIDTPDGKNYFWRALNETAANSKKGWEKVTGAIELPLLKTAQYRISIYLWNLGKKQILIDDIEVTFIEEAD
ncbi:MAG: hypothetical protein A3F72_05630 [Bacteroidetes bacterium RIFCSPLOWO2_12_FULL_35_15]|nr:MAG: hypothetical protein A3F72_05630 [Bacteroidetes bacterium RIFCSPLOWO2_12_FULL_35_15]